MAQLVTRVALTCNAVLFDLDGVLVDSEPVVVRTWNRWAARHKLDVPDLVRRAHGRRSVQTVFRLAQVKLTTPATLVAAEDVDNGKPAPDGYILAAQRLGSDSRNCVVIEDTPAGVEAGRSAGATVIAIATTFAASALRHADVVVQSLPEIQATVAEGVVRLTIDTR